MLFAKLLHCVSHDLIRFKGAHSLIDDAVVGIQQGDACVIGASGGDCRRTGDNDFVIVLQWPNQNRPNKNWLVAIDPNRLTDQTIKSKLCKKWTIIVQFAMMMSLWAMSLRISEYYSVIQVMLVMHDVPLCYFVVSVVDLLSQLISRHSIYQSRRTIQAVLLVLVNADECDWMLWQWHHRMLFSLMVCRIYCGLWWWRYYLMAVPASRNEGQWLCHLIVLNFHYLNYFGCYYDYLLDSNHFGLFAVMNLNVSCFCVNHRRSHLKWERVIASGQTHEQIPWVTFQ